MTTQIPKEEPITKPYHWFFSTPWWTINSILICLLFITLGIDALSVFWQTTPGESIWTSIVGIIGIVFATIPGPLSLLSSKLRKAGKGSNYQVPKNWKHQGKAIGACFIFCITGFLIPMTIVASKAVDDAAAKSKAENALNNPWDQYEFGGGEFVVSVPSNWQPVQNQELAKGNFQFYDGYNDVGLIVIAIKKMDSTFKSIQELQTFSINNAKSVGTNHSVEKLPASSYDGFPMTETVIKYEIDNQVITTVIRHVEYPETWIQLNLWGRPSTFSGSMETLRQIANSVTKPPKSTQ